MIWETKAELRLIDIRKNKLRKKRFEEEPEYLDDGKNKKLEEFER